MVNLLIYQLVIFTKILMIASHQLSVDEDVDASKPESIPGSFVLHIRVSVANIVNFYSNIK